MENITRIIDLIYVAKREGIELVLNEEKLQIKMAENVKIDKNLLDEIRSNKKSIIDFLSEENWKSKSIGNDYNKIKKFDRSSIERIPLSFSQERLWFIDRLEGSVHYHIPAVLRLSGNLNVPALHSALQHIVDRHEALRTVFYEHQGHAYQSVTPQGLWAMALTPGEAYREDAHALQEYIAALIRKPFDLQADPMIRAELIMLGHQQHVLVVTLHHIASDGWSRPILVRELAALYTAFDLKQPHHLAPLPLQYADFALWQRSYLQGDLLGKKLAYWKEKLDGTAPLELSTDFPRTAIRSTSGAAASFVIDKQFTGKIALLARQHNATLFMVLLAAFKTLLYRYTGQSDICVGSPIAGRQQQQAEDLIGFFVNTLALRSEVNGSHSFTDLLNQVKNTTLQAYEHQDVPFEKVVEATVKERDMSRSPLFQVMLVLQNTPEVPRLQLGEVLLSAEPFEANNVKFDLTFSFQETADGLKGSAEYSTGLFAEGTIERMTAHFTRLLAAVVLQPLCTIADLPMLSEQEKHKLLFEFNNTLADYPTDKTIIDLFEEQVRKAPLATALVFDDTEVSYLDLNQRANQLAHLLKSKGVKEETLVPLCIERSVEMIVAILAILKAGAAYVPIDPDYPDERIHYMIADTAATLVITDTKNNAKPAFAGIDIVETGAALLSADNLPADNLNINIKPYHLAYVIYTSGSTGTPKGVMVEHGNVVRLFKTETPLFDFNEKDAWTMFHSFCFDFSVWEMFGALLLGGRLVVVPAAATKDVALFCELLINQKISVLNQTPSAFYGLQDYIARQTAVISIRYVIFGGEALNAAKLAPWKQLYNHCGLVNMYGITETTVHVTFQLMEWHHIHSGSSSIGKPIPTLCAYILDADQNLLPCGIAGELYVAGAGVARGYLNNPILTHEKFIAKSFKGETQRLYKTGDLGRWLPDGNIEYLGRIDDQVKIRGYRIELGEIESVLQQCELVQQTAVIAKEDKNGNKRLVAYVVPVYEGGFDKEALISWLAARLPSYMAPALWVEINALPLTPNGKTDKKALPDPEGSQLPGSAFAPPRNKAQADLAEIWQDLLGVQAAGIHDNFFELGGDSIITIQVVSRARLLGYELHPKDIFIHQTIEKLSVAIAGRTKEGFTGEQGLLTGTAGLLPIQQWYLQRERSDISHFNQAVLLAIDKALPAPVLTAAVKHLTAQHDALRFTYHQHNGQWKQEYGNREGEVVTEDLSSAPPELLTALITERADTFQRSLDIEKGTLARFVLMKMPPAQDKDRLLIVIHHLAVDGVSWRILLQDLDTVLDRLHSGTSLTPSYKATSYRQWHQALSAYSLSKKLLSQKEYWLQAAKNTYPLRTDKEYTRPVRVRDTAHFTLSLQPELTRLLLQEAPKAYHTEINDLLLCALAKTLCEYNNTSSVIIGLEGHGREDIAPETDTSRSTGWFTSLYPVLLQAARGQESSELIKSVKEQLRSVPDKGLGYGVLKYISKEEGLLGEDCWDIVFNYLGQVDNVVSKGKWLAQAAEPAGASRSENHLLSEKLSLNCIIQAGKLAVRWTYSSRHYEQESIAQLARTYLSVLSALINNCAEQLKAGVAIYTPSDYGLSPEVSYRELDTFLTPLFKDTLSAMYRLSGLQQGMLFHSLYHPQAGAYIEQFGCDLINPDLNVFSKSWDNVLANHSILRSSFYYDTFSVPVQCVLQTVHMPVEVTDLQHLDPIEQQQAISLFQINDRQKGFDLTAAPLMRIALLQLSTQRFRMLWTSHHILFDGWSMPLIIEEFLNTYELLASGKDLPQQPEDKYEDYIRYTERQDKDQQQTYWQGYLNNLEQSTLLPFIKPTPERNKGAGAYASVFLITNQNQTQAIEELCRKNRITVNTLMQGIWALMLHTYTGNEHIAFGVTVSGRPDDLPNVEKRVGMFINTLPLLSSLQHTLPITQWLQNLQIQQLASRQYQYTPLHLVQQYTTIQGDLFDTLLVFENYPVSKIIASKKWGLQVENVLMHEQTNYPLALLIHSAEQINIRFSYNTDLLPEASAQKIRDHFEHVLTQVIEKPAALLRDIELITPAEKNQVLSEFNNTHADYPTDKTITGLFEEQVEKFPLATAVVFENTEVSYQQLNQKANQLAHLLRSKGVKEETLVPLCIERSVEMIVAILAILKAGAAYVPIDPDYPDERIRFVLSDTAASLVITSSENASKLPALTGIEIIEADTALPDPDLSENNLNINIQPHHLAYVIYTSGSTGTPKGVMVEHFSVINLIYHQVRTFKISERENILQFSNYNFDASVEQIFLAFNTGSSLILVNKELQENSELLSQLIIQKQITHLHATPSYLETLTPSKETSLKRVIAGGEQCSLQLAQKWGKYVPFFNEYGPTEATVTIIEHEFSLTSNLTILPIGKPISNSLIYILSTTGNLTPLGVPGEICISGAGVARGYLNRPELTAEKFVADPFGSGGGKMYRTGDLGRWLPDGNIEYLGRIDDQVKIRGYRIEPGEIESALQQSGLVRQAVVLARDDNHGNKRLVAYVVAEVFDKEALTSRLAASLPAYMVPALWVEMDALPLTPNGKIDKKALPDPDMAALAYQPFAAPRNPAEEALALIWQQVLALPLAPGIHDNFFELGGHSLLVTRAVAAVRRELHTDLAIKDLFVHPSIAQLAAHINTLQKGLFLPPLQAQARPALIPLSFSQERLWFIDQFEGSLQYHMPVVLRLTGPLRPDALDFALTSIVDRHEALRTVVRSYHDQPFQHILPPGQWQMNYVSASQFLPEELQQYPAAFNNRPFDLGSDYMLRAALISPGNGSQEHILVMTLHHIASDGWSVSVLAKELAELYTSFVQQRPYRLPSLPVQYADFAIWQRSYLQGDLLGKKLSYWKEKLDGTAPLELSTDFPRTAIRSTSGAAASFVIDKPLAGKIALLARQHNATLFMVLLAAFKTLLYRYTGQSDICVGSPIAGRQQQQAEDLIGFFVNTLALRSEVNGSDSFIQLLQQVKATTLQAYEHQDVPFEKVVEATVKERDMSRSPLFQVMLVLQNTPEVPRLQLGEVLLSAEPFEANNVKFDLTFSFQETADGLKGSAEYSTGLFAEGTIERMTAHFTRLLEAVVLQPLCTIAELPMLAEQENNQLLFEFNNTLADYPADKTIIDLFEEQVLKSPLATAVVFEQAEVSYLDLNQKANRLAHLLRSRGVKEETLVPLCIERSVEMIVAILAILKAGAAYVPIDPDYPDERIQYMIADTAAQLVLVDRNFSYQLFEQSSEIVYLNINDNIGVFPLNNFSRNNTFYDIACVIYTSGSSGKSKGVKLPNSGITNRLYWMWNSYPFKKHEKCALKTSIGFADHIWELFGPLLRGISSVLLKTSDILDLNILIEKLSFNQITRWVLVPSLLRVLIDKFIVEGITLEHLEYWTCSGELLSYNLVNDFYKVFASGLQKLLNIYGSTEVSADATCYDTSVHFTKYSSLYNFSSDIKVSIGKPISNFKVYIVSTNNHLLPLGVPGEICISGAGVARGYLNRPELTAEKFVADPFGSGGGKMYRTGDLGRWLPDGNIEYLGRIDDQVKIRGYRIEPGEIESALQQSGLVRQAVVLARDDNHGNKRLVAYVVAEVFDKEALTSRLAASLPAYMVPALWVEMDALPLTPNGKIDKKALPDPDVAALAYQPFAAPRNPAEEALALIWQQVLALPLAPGIHDNFFELGGHSLMAMRAMAAMRKELKAEVPVKDLFAHPTIARLAAHLQEISLHSRPALSLPELLPRPALIPLSFSQERLWFIDRLEGSASYHLPAILRLKGAPGTDALRHALQAVVDRHEALRTVIREQEGQPYQHINPPGQWRMALVDGEAYKDDPAALQQFIETLVKTPFDLAADPMLRAHLITLEPHHHILAVTLHHIASDAWSLSVIVKEFMEAYSSFEMNRPPLLAPLPLQYADFAIWQRNSAQEEVIAQKLGYWKEKLANTPPLQLPTDFTRPALPGIQGGTERFTTGKALAASLNLLARQNGATLFMTLLAAFKVLLYRYSGQKDICAGTSIANRPWQELEGLAGFFVNTLALRSEVNPAAPFTDLLLEVKNTTLGAYEHQDVPFEKVVEAVVKERDMSRSPLFQVMIVLQNTPSIPALKLARVQLSAEEFAPAISKFDLTFFITETREGLAGAVQYRSDLFSAHTVRRMAAHFTQLLQSIVSRPWQSPAALQMILPQEEQRLLSFAAASVACPKDTTITALFEEQVRKTPMATAVVFENTRLTYQQLNGQANRIARLLRSKGVTAETTVPLCMEPGALIIAAILGILKAGAAYVPVDPAFPLQRIQFMIQDSAAKVILTTTQTASTLPFPTHLTLIEADAFLTGGGAFPEDNLHLPALAGHLAYVIYTSGSTGTPKGVMIQHDSLIDYTAGLQQQLSTDRCRSFALLSTIATDLGNTVIYSSLLSGAALHLFSKETLSDSYALASYFEKNPVDCIKIVPSHWKALSEHQMLLPTSLLIFGGEALPCAITEAIAAAGASCTIVNHYGPTETTIGKLLHVISPQLAYGPYIPIGRPFSNTSAYVLSEDLALCPTGVPGLLFIAGDGLARGYLNNETLTSEKFIANPFDNTRPRLYRTGDRVKYLPDGNILFIARADDQVKIRGNRVEPAEIETVLLHSGLVRMAAVVPKEDKQGNLQLIAYIVAQQGRFEKAQVMDYLKNNLPDYMVPAILVPLDDLPLTPNGKTDRKALPDPEEVILTSFAAPRNPTEEKLALLWVRLLQVDTPGIHDDFFELGGHSLLAIRLISLIRKELTAEVKINDVFDFPTIAGLANHIDRIQGNAVVPPITLQPRPERIPLSFSQERLWFIDRLEGSVHYHVPAVLRLSGNLNIPALHYALQHIVDRHEVLRTVFYEHQGHAYQSVTPQGQWAMTLTPGEAFLEDAHALQEYIAALIRKPFDLQSDPMIRAELITLGHQQHVLVVTLHHIASDGWSRPILVRELAALYTAFDLKQPHPLAPLPLQYADFALWQRSYLQGDLLGKKLSYWKEKLDGTAPLELSTDFPRTAIRSTSGAAATFAIDKPLAGKIALLARQHNATLFMVLLAAFKTLLYRYTGQSDICVGSPIAGRQQQQAEDLIGFFVNTLALRSEVNGSDSFIQLLQQVKATTLQAYEHQDVPFEKVVEASVKERDMSRSPLFQVMLVLQNTPEVPRLQLGEVLLSAEPFEANNVKFDLTFSFQETADGLKGSAEYSTGLFAEGTIERMTAHFTRLLEAVVLQPLCTIAELPMLAEQENNQLLFEFNNTLADYPTDKTIIDLFEEQVLKSPLATAVVFEQAEVSYLDLNQKANRLAHLLRSRGVKEETLVPLCIERSVEMIVAILAILKAGAAYVPIDPDYPDERIQYIIADTAATLVITDAKSKTKPTFAGIDIVETGAALLSADNLTADNLNININPHHLAYVIYTSGSTGTPKGVMVEHGNVVSLVKGVEYVCLSPQDVLLSTGSPSFDATTFEYWAMLLNGGQLILAPEHTLLNPALLKEVIRNRGVSIMWFTSSWFNQLIDTDISVFQSLRTILAGGEKLSAPHIQKIKKSYQNIDIINGYGPTENTTFSVTCYINPTTFTDSVPIGRPLSNRQAYILDELQQPVAIGIPGEIYVAGAGVARGYLNNPILTNEKFIEKSFKGATQRLYKTGDRGRWLPNGNIEYLGRIDDQVKIRGYRIEPGEIESVLQQCELVQQAAVLAKEDKNGNKRLVAYVVPDGLFEREAIIDYLKTRLPSYMIPAMWAELDAFPLTSNGKTDKNALPEIKEDISSQKQYIAPRNELEARLTEIWQELLDVETVGINDNFFELGGDSIITIQLVSRARRLGYDLKIADIFTVQTIAGLSKIAEELSEEAGTGEQGVLTGFCGLLPIQQWYLDRSHEEISHFNQAVLLTIDKAITETMLNEVVSHLVKQHDALRFKYYQKNGKWQQEYEQKNKTKLISEDLRSAQKDLLSSLISNVADTNQRKLAIENGELLHVVWMQTPSEEPANRLLIVIHHLATDGVSWRILLSDLQLWISELTAGSDISGGSKSNSYRQWYQALQKYGQSHRLFSQREYWQKIVNNSLPLPVDKKYDEPVKLKDVARHTVQLEEGKTKQLIQEIPRVYHTEINDLLLAALAKTLCNWSKEESVTIGLEGHGREKISEETDTSRTVGWFTNLYPIQLKTNRESDDNLIKAVKEQLRLVPDKGIGYGVLKYINKEEILQNKQVWDVVFNYLGQLDNIVVNESKWIGIARESSGNSISEKYAINEKVSVNCSIQGGRLILNWSYSSKHYEQETIVTLAENYLNILKTLINHCIKQQDSGKTVFTPSDYGLASEITYEELDRFLEEEEDNINNILSF